MNAGAHRAYAHITKLARPILPRIDPNYLDCARRHPTGAICFRGPPEGLPASGTNGQSSNHPREEAKSP
jgi:hypothetical protein